MRGILCQAARVGNILPRASGGWPTLRLQPVAGRTLQVTHSPTRSLLCLASRPDQQMIVSKHFHRVQSIGMAITRQPSPRLRGGALQRAGFVSPSHSTISTTGPQSLAEGHARCIALQHACHCHLGRGRPTYRNAAVQTKTDRLGPSLTGSTLLSTDKGQGVI